MKLDPGVQKHSFEENKGWLKKENNVKSLKKNSLDSWRECLKTKHTHTHTHLILKLI